MRFEPSFSEGNRNKIEKLTIATLEHLPTCIIFITDLSGLCGTSVADQLSIRAELYERFGLHRPWVDVLSKSTLVPVLGGRVSSYSDYSWSDKNDIEALNTSYYLIGEGALVASAEEGFGVEELRQRREAPDSRVFRHANRHIGKVCA